MLSFTGNYEFLAKDSLITDLKQNLLGKVGRDEKDIRTQSSGEQPGNREPPIIIIITIIIIIIIR